MNQFELWLAKFFKVIFLKIFKSKFIKFWDFFEGSIVIDCLSSNGDPDPPAIQRVFWAATEGVTATVLLVAGGSEGLAALQSAGLIAGLPFTIVLFLMCTSIWKCVRVGAGDIDPAGPSFEVGLLDCIGARPYKG